MSEANQRPDANPGVTAAYSPLLVGRTATKEAAFFVPHLSPGMTLLDCGCGHGTITVGLAQFVAPGLVVGIDRDHERIDAARRYAAEQEVTNVEFRVGDIEQLPFAEGSFDAAFEHAVLMYLPDPVRVVQEIRRVLKPGGVFGARDTDFAASFNANLNPVLEQAFALARSWYAHRRTNMEFGRQLRGLLTRAEFASVVASASCDFHGTPEQLREWSGTWKRILLQEELVRFASEAGIADQDAIAHMCEAVEAWGEHSDSFHASVMGEAVGWKEG